MHGLKSKTSNPARPTQINSGSALKKVTPKKPNQVLMAELPHNLNRTKPKSRFSGFYGKNIRSLLPQFYDEEQIQNVADNSSLPEMVPSTKIETFKQLGVGHKNIGQGIVHVEETFVQDSHSCLAQMGLMICFLDCSNQHILTTIKLLHQCYNHYVHHHMLECYTMEAKESGNSMPRRIKRPFRNLLWDARSKFAVNQYFQMQYQKIISVIHSHRNDEYSTKHPKYVIKTLPFLSETANNVFRCLDKVMTLQKKNLLNCLKLTCRNSQKASAATPTFLQHHCEYCTVTVNTAQSLHCEYCTVTVNTAQSLVGVGMSARLEHAACQLLVRKQEEQPTSPSPPTKPIMTLLPLAPKNLPLDFYNPEWFNDLQPNVIELVANTNSVAFLHKSFKFFQGTRDHAPRN
ncbi:hypothetical protein VP01_1022g9 [Puccinia sorghi]|uniref:Uncharacterized protein n=1 Tax=Puccinia sorghi TaxID=27349 RepID=A0A0L6VUQ8_9BASI|nr:hypothetical protein VP01_1022g9 [Puccinia sorghi]